MQIASPISDSFATHSTCERQVGYEGPYLQYLVFPKRYAAQTGERNHGAIYPNTLPDEARVHASNE